MGGFHTVCEGTDEGGQQKEGTSKIEFDGEKFKIPAKIYFNKQSTFAEVEHAARAFCHKNTISSSNIPVLTRIIAYRHQKMFQNIWTSLKEQQRQEFLQDLNNIEHDLMDSLYHHFVLGKNKRLHIDRPILLQPAFATFNQSKNNEWLEIGRKILKQNKVTMVFMCAGSSLRFGEDKFLCPIGKDQTSILDLMFMRLRRNTNGISIPIILNCSVSNQKKIQNYLISKHFFGFQQIKIRCFPSKRLTIFNNKKQYCVNNHLQFIKRAAGTAYAALHLINTKKFTNFLQVQGTEYVCFSGMENLMENPCDPIFLGMLADQKKQMGAKCVVAKFNQKFPRYYRTEQTASKVSFLNESHMKSVSNEVAKLPIGINSMIFRFDFLKSIVQDFSKYMFVAEHYDVIEKQEIVYNVTLKMSEKMQCLSFQKDIRFLTTCCQNPLIYKVDRQKQYAPILSKKKEYSLGAAYENYSRIIEKDMKQYIQSFV